MKKINQAMFSLVAASLVVGTPVWAVEQNPSKVDKATVIAENETTKKLIQKSLDNLAEVLPYMKEFTVQEMDIDEHDVVVVTLKKDTAKSSPKMEIFLDKIRGKSRAFQ